MPAHPDNPTPQHRWRCREVVLEWTEPPRVMGIVNVTPDSFSDGGRHFAADLAVAHGLRLMEEGADLLDVGGESTRPGADPVPEAEELRRVLPVVTGLLRGGVRCVSVDTRKAAVAQAVLEAGAQVINDVSGLADPRMAETVARYRAGLVIMHMRGEPRTMQDAPHYDDVVAEVGAFLRERLERALAAGVPAESVVLDPGIGFGKTLEHNLALLRNLDRLGARRPVLIGVSRKRVIGELAGGAPADRDPASAVVAACLVGRGAHILRVHDVKGTCDALRVAVTLRRERGTHALG